MDSYSFAKYNHNCELPDGDYWKFVVASDEEIDELLLTYSNLCNLIPQIQNQELKEKMKDKLFSLAKRRNILSIGEYFLKSGLFNDDEIKEIIDSNNCYQIIKDKINKESIKEYDVIPYIKIYFNSKDKNWVVNNILNILNLVKDQDFFNDLLISLLEIVKDKDQDLFNIFFEKFKNKIPEYYLNYLKINSDNNYLLHKKEKYLTEHLKIGIDPSISIAPEVEANNYNGLTIDFYAQNGFKGKFTNYSDATVPNGKEINCVPFHDTIEELASFKAVLDSLKEIGYYYSTLDGNASGQINLGLSYLDSGAAIIIFYEIFCNVEELLFYISNKKGELTRQSLYQNSRFKPISEIIGTRVINEDISREEVIRLFNTRMDLDAEIKGLSYKKNTICLRGNNESNYRFEIRIPNGGVDYDVYIDNIRLYAKMMEVAKKLADASKKEYYSQDEYKLMELKLSLEDNNLSLKDKLIVLMNMLFVDEEIKKIYYERFDSAIKKLDNSDEIDRYYVPPKYLEIEPMFDEVEFRSKYESKIDEEPVGYYDPETGEYIEYGKKSKL